MPQPSKKKRKSGENMISECTANIIVRITILADKIATMQDVCGTRLLPLPLPLAEMSDYTTVRVAFNAMLCAEGFKSIWTQGQDPPASVVEWWGDQDHDIFALLNESDISATTTK